MTMDELENIAKEHAEKEIGGSLTCVTENINSMGLPSVKFTFDADDGRSITVWINSQNGEIEQSDVDE